MTAARDIVSVYSIGCSADACKCTQDVCYNKQNEDDDNDLMMTKPPTTLTQMFGFAGMTTC